MGAAGGGGEQGRGARDNRVRSTADAAAAAGAPEHQRGNGRDADAGKRYRLGHGSDGDAASPVAQAVHEGDVAPVVEAAVEEQGGDGRAEQSVAGLNDLVGGGVAAGEDARGAAIEGGVERDGSA